MVTLVIILAVVLLWFVVAAIVRICGLKARNQKLQQCAEKAQQQANLIDSMRHQLAATDARLEVSNTQLEAATTQCVQLQNALDAANGAIEGLLAQHNDAEKGVDAVHVRVDEAAQQLETLNGALVVRQRELEGLGCRIEEAKGVLEGLLRHQESVLALARNNDDGLVCVLKPCLDPAAARLAALCEEVIELAAHPEITKALRGFVWSRLWLPVFQRMLKGGGVWDARNAIYLLRSRTDPGLCYVGQAACLRERWYQHARKLLGVDGCGNERLYGEGLRVDDLEWCVVTEGLAGSDLSTTESYYIKWFGADSNGLNKKR